jgi:uncharacterized RDD family membrane protein YckC
VKTPPPSGYAGFVTRAVAITIDVLLINAVAVVVGGAVSLVASSLGANGSLNAVEAAIGGFAWFLWSAAYFVTFWTLTGQTPGNRLLGIRVVAATGGAIRPARAVRRFIGLIISAIPLGAGFLPVLFNDERRGVADLIARTVVLWDVPELAVAAATAQAAAATELETLEAPALAPPATMDPSDGPPGDLDGIGPTVLS